MLADELRLNSSSRKSISALTNYRTGPDRPGRRKRWANLLIARSNLALLSHRRPDSVHPPPASRKSVASRKKCLEHRPYKHATAGSYTVVPIVPRAAKPARPKDGVCRFVHSFFTTTDARSVQSLAAALFVMNNDRRYSSVHQRELHGRFLTTDVAQFCRFVIFRRFMRICAVSLSLFHRLYIPFINVSVTFMPHNVCPRSYVLLSCFHFCWPDAKSRRSPSGPPP